MIALLFEVEPKDGHEDHYFKHAAALRPILDQHEGMLFINRYRSLDDPTLILSHSRWRDEEAVTKWRTDKTHYRAQVAGYNVHFKDYRLRISNIIAAHGIDAPIDNNTALNVKRLVVISLSSEKPSVDAFSRFKSVYEENAYLTIEPFVNLDKARAHFDKIAADGEHYVSLLCSVSRDYGMFERAEAPQECPLAMTY